MKTHDYGKHAGEYARLGVDDANYLAFRDVPRLIEDHTKGREALDFGCGAGRSTRFLKSLGLEVTGVDISADMLAQAKARDASTSYQQVRDGHLPFANERFDIVFSSFVFLEVATRDGIEEMFREMKRVLRKDGVMVVITSAEDVYKGRWVGFRYDFPENARELRSGDTFTFQFEGTDIVLHDYLWTDQDYREILDRVGLRIVELHNPLGNDSDPFDWRDETTVSPVAIYVIARS